MVPISSDALMKPAVLKHETKETIVFFFVIAQPSVNKWPYLLGHLSHGNFLNTILSSCDSNSQLEKRKYTMEVAKRALYIHCFI